MWPAALRWRKAGAPHDAGERSGLVKTAAGLFAVMALTLAAGAVGLLRPVDHALASFRFDLVQRPASQTLTVVEIDAASIRAAGQWPWGRERFAHAIRLLQDAGADTVALDVDFSARSSPASDLALRDTVERRPGAVVLPAFVQTLRRGASERVVESMPLGVISQQAVIASVNVPVDGDGQARRYRYGFGAGEQHRPSMGALLGAAPYGRTGDFLIDYGIRASSVPNLSFEDVHAGRFDPALVKGRKILIGSTALELGDEFATPTSGGLPGVYVHALAYESIHAGRDLRQLNPLVVFAFAVWAAYLLRPRRARDLQKMLVRHVTIAAAAIGGPMLLQAATPVVADTGAILLTQLLCLIWLVRFELARRARAVIEARETHLRELAEHMRESRDSIHAAHEELKVVNVELDKALRARTDFLAMTSHEIRTPLNGIMGMTQVILADRTLSEPLRDKVSLVHASGETMLALVDDILDVAKMESGNLTISPAKMDLHKLLDETLRLWADKAQTKGLAVRLEAGDTPAWIVEDGGRLRQILFNLASNAIKFTESGEVAICARVDGADGGEALVLEVRDSGIGIPADKLGQIFEAFAQVDGSVTRKYGGTGLGLAISRRLAQAMGGDLSVESELGRGSRFIVRLPLTRAAADVRDAAAAAGEHAGSLASASLLLVEANPLAQGVMKAALGGEVRTLDVATSAEEARQALGSRRFDLVLVEGRVLSAEGTDVRAALSLLVGEAKGAKVAVLWGGAPEDAQGLQDAGADRVVLKPVGAADLVEDLRTLCAQPARRIAAMEAPAATAIAG